MIGTVARNSTVERVEPENKLRCNSPTFGPSAGGLNVFNPIMNLGGTSRARRAIRANADTVNTFSAEIQGYIFPFPIVTTNTVCYGENSRRKKHVRRHGCETNGGNCMQVPMEIAYRGVEKSDAISSLIDERAERLEKVCTNIISCRVAVEKEQDTHPIYRCRVIVRTPPEHEIVAKRESPDRGVHESALRYIVGETFDAAEKQLKQVMAKRRRDVKSHPEHEPAAVVVRLFREDGYGFLMTLDGREIYFHKNSVFNGGFERLEVGTGVRFEEAEGKEGPQASTVHVADKPGVHVQDDEEVDVPLGWQARGG